jgi:hypothetical protein
MIAPLTEESILPCDLLDGYLEPYYIYNGMKLSRANPLHRLLLQKLKIIKIHNNIKISADLNRTLDIFLDELKDVVRDEKLLRDFLLEVHLSYVRDYTQKRFWVREDNIHDSNATEQALGNDEDVASRLAAIYYKNLGITAEDIYQVVSQYIRQTGRSVQDIDLSFATHIANIDVDNGRYKLITLLPDGDNCTLFKSVIRAIQYNDDQEQVLSHLKADVQKCLATYTSYWKLSWFGHHHNQRALEVKVAINNCRSLADIRSVLLNQKDIIEGKETPCASPLLAERWSSTKFLVNKKINYQSSGFYQAVTAALASLPMEKVIKDANKTPSPPSFRGI